MEIATGEVPAAITFTVAAQTKVERVSPFPEKQVLRQVQLAAQQVALVAFAWEEATCLCCMTGVIFQTCADQF